MPAPSAHEVTQLLTAWSAGDENALDKLVPLVYQELHRIARGYMARERSGHTLQTSALINEAYLRLIDFQQIQWQNRAHFFGICAQLMRRVLIDFARSRRYVKRGGVAVRVPLQDMAEKASLPSADIVAVDDALKALANIDERKSRVVELRFFGGLTVPETAEVLKISSETVMRDWKFAKVWLVRELSRENHDAI